MIIAVTGHRPDKLWGYDLKYHKYKECGKELKEKESCDCEESRKRWGYITSNLINLIKSIFAHVEIILLL